MGEDIKGLQQELQDFIREQREGNKRVEVLVAQLVEKLGASDGLAGCEEQFGQRLEQLERVIRLVKSDMPRLTTRINELGSEVTDMRYKRWYGLSSRKEPSDRLLSIGKGIQYCVLYF